MLFPASLLPLLSLAPTAWAIAHVPRTLTRTRDFHLDSDVQFRCGNQPDDHHKFDASEARFSAIAQKGNFSSETIPVYFHVIRAGLDIKEGNLPSDKVKEQIATLNDRYQGTGFQFDLQNIDYTDNADWFYRVSDDTPQQTAMKAALRQGDSATLNLYSVSFNVSNLLGYATFPDDYTNDPKDDGVVIQYASLPNITTSAYNLGITTVHEVGHWMGLFHTFMGGCDGPGDYCDDTPPEAEAAFGCPVNRDTCSSTGGDPIRNYMDYTDDACLSQFTPNQIERMQTKWQTFRQVSSGGGGGGSIISFDPATSTQSTSPTFAPPSYVTATSKSNGAYAGLPTCIPSNGNGTRAPANLNADGSASSSAPSALSTPAIIGIAIGGLIGLLLIASNIFLFVQNRKLSKQVHYHSISFPAPEKHRDEDRMPFMHEPIN